MNLVYNDLKYNSPGNPRKDSCIPGGELRKENLNWIGAGIPFICKFNLSRLEP